MKYFFHENERNCIIVMSITELPLIGWSMIKMFFNDQTFDRAQLGLPSWKQSIRNHLSWKKTKSTNFHFLKKHYFVWHSKDLWALEKLIIVSRGREGSSHLCGEVFVESKTLCPPGTTHCCSALSRATFGKGTQAGCGSSIFFFLNSRIDVTLASIHIPASMWGSNCEGYPFGLSGSWLPLTGSWVSAELATLYSGRLPDLSSWHFPNWVGVGAQGGICARWKCEWFPMKTESQLKNIWEKLPFISPS